MAQKYEINVNLLWIRLCLFTFFFKFATDNQTINPLWLKITILPTKTNPL